MRRVADAGQTLSRKAIYSLQIDRHGYELMLVGVCCLESHALMKTCLSCRPFKCPLLDVGTAGTQAKYLMTASVSGGHAPTRAPLSALRSQRPTPSRPSAKVTAEDRSWFWTEKRVDLRESAEDLSWPTFDGADGDSAKTADPDSASTAIPPVTDASPDPPKLTPTWFFRKPVTSFRLI